MPKMKTRRAATKRFRVRRTGKIEYLRAGMRHNLGDMRSKDQRRQSKTDELAPEMRSVVLRMLGRR
jgi:ribosomal protein L35